MTAKPLTPKMVAMLRSIPTERYRSCPLPYRLGATNTADALHRRGLVGIFAKDTGGKMMFLTDAGRAAVAALNAAES